jgi:hypothetical protein
MPARHATTLVAITRHRRGEKPQQMGSGVLVTLFGKYFLISATHVLEEANIALPGTPLWEAGRIFLSKPIGANPKDDKLDIGFILLNDTTVKALTKAGRTFLPAHGVPIEVEGFRDTVYVFGGFPASHSTTRMNPVVIDSTPTFITGDGLRQERMFRLQRDPFLYVGIHYDREKQWDEERKIQIIGPTPEGMSGGPIWLILPNGVPALMAIGTDYDPKERVVFGTFLQPLIKLLKQNFDPTATPGLFDNTAIR